MDRKGKEDLRIKKRKVEQLSKKGGDKWTNVTEKKKREAERKEGDS